ncbi:30S ribosomal protein S11 [Streptomyces thinghirensis]|nr:30S ribosomal protein S11 [Streptomyces thinghirensis]
MPPKGRQGAAKKVRRREKKNVAHGHAHIKSTFNNDDRVHHGPDRQRDLWASAGHVGFKGSRKSTPFAAQDGSRVGCPSRSGSTACARSTSSSGRSSGRETAIRSLQATGLEVGSIQDGHPTPHNGCRPPKRRRV